MNTPAANQFANKSDGHQSVVTEARKPSAAKSRMRQMWKAIRARRRSLPLTGPRAASAYHPTDRYQMCSYVG